MKSSPERCQGDDQGLPWGTQYRPFWAKPSEGSKSETKVIVVGVGVVVVVAVVRTNEYMCVQGSMLKKCVGQSFGRFYPEAHGTQCGHIVTVN